MEAVSRGNVWQSVAVGRPNLQNKPSTTPQKRPQIETVMQDNVMPMDALDRALVSTVGWSDSVSSQQIVMAVVVLAVFLLSAPRGRRWLSWGSIFLLVAAFVPLAVAAVFPSSVEKTRVAHLVLRFFVVASLLHSLLLVAAVSLWERCDRPMPKIFLDLLRCFAVALALLTVLWEAGIDATELLTGSALITAVFGFALKDTLGNVFAGLAIHAEHSFEIGDWIQYDENTAHIGRVVEINWRATKVITLDEAYVIIPNGQLAQASIRNFTQPDPWSRRSLYVVTPYEVSPQRVQGVILDAIRGSFGVLEHPVPSVVTNSFMERGVEHWVRFFTVDFDKRDRVDGMARDRIWYALARHGIDIPVATQAIRLTQFPTTPKESPEEVVDRLTECLKQVGLLDSLTPSQLRRLAETNAEHVYGIGEQIIHQDASGSSMFVIIDGHVNVTVAAGNAAPHSLAILGTGDYFGEMSLMTGASRSATVTALSQTRALEVSSESFRGVLAADPTLVEKIGKSLSVRMAGRSQAVAELEQIPAQSLDILQRIREFFGVQHDRK